MRYVLVQCGTPDPQGYGGAQRIEIPVRRLAIMSTTQLPHLEILDALDRQDAISDIEMVHSPLVRERFAAGELAGAITGFGQHLLTWAKERLEAEGARV